MVVPQARSSETMDVRSLVYGSFDSWCWIGVECACLWRQLVVVVIGAIEDDGPAWREDVVHSMEVIRLEIESAKDRRHGERLAIGQVDD